MKLTYSLWVPRRVARIEYNYQEIRGTGRSRTICVAARENYHSKNIQNCDVSYQVNCKRISSFICQGYRSFHFIRTRKWRLPYIRDDERSASKYYILPFAARNILLHHHYRKPSTLCKIKMSIHRILLSDTRNPNRYHQKSRNYDYDTKWEDRMKNKTSMNKKYLNIKNEKKQSTKHKLKWNKVKWDEEKIKSPWRLDSHVNLVCPARGALLPSMTFLLILDIVTRPQSTPWTPCRDEKHSVDVSIHEIFSQWALNR